MKVSTPIYFLSFLLIASMFFGACKEDGPQRVISYDITCVKTVNSNRRLPDGSYIRVNTIDTITDVLEIEEWKNDTIKIVSWQTGCGLPICCISPPCSDQKLALSPNKEYHADYEHDQLNDLTISFYPDYHRFNATYEWERFYWEDVYDYAADTLKYSEYLKKSYRFYSHN